jgi:hypothetical protein
VEELAWVCCPRALENWRLISKRPNWMSAKRWPSESTKNQVSNLLLTSERHREWNSSTLSNLLPNQVASRPFSVNPQVSQQS